MRSQEHVKRFVRQTLGCTCPDEVFDQIEYQDAVTDEAPDTRKITIGQRLLIYVWETDDPAMLEDKLPTIVVAGKRERDRRHLNRFRAVIAANDFDRIASVAERVFGNLSDRDEKIHLPLPAMEMRSRRRVVPGRRRRVRMAGVAQGPQVP